MSAAQTSGTSQSEARRSLLALLFADLSDSGLLSARLEPEEYRAMLQVLRENAAQVGARHGGTLISIQGDGVLLAFGLPDLAEESGQQATLAALELHARIAAVHLPFVPADRRPLQLHSGIHRGRVLVTDGDIERGLVDVRGEIANMAHALSSLALPGEILVTAPTIARHEHRFQHRPLPTQRRRPEAAWTRFGEVLSVEGLRSIAETDDTTIADRLPYFERDDAVPRLLRFALGRNDGAGRCLVVQAEAGVGKSRLLRQFVAAARQAGLTLHRGHCERYPAPEVLQPFRQMLAAASVPPAEAAGVPARVRELLAGAPGLLVIDDWQWADDASRRLLDELMAADEPVRALLATRPRLDGLPWLGDAEELALRAFDSAESDAAIQCLRPQAHPFERRRIHAEAGGVPLYIEELCQARLGIPGAGPRPPGPAADAPAGLHAVVIARLDRLPTGVGALVRAAAVVGVRAPLELLAAALDGPPDTAAIHQAAQADLLHPESAGLALCFRHGITRAAVYESIGLNERRRMHGRVARHLLSITEPDRVGEVCEALAQHFRGADDADEGARYAEMAGIKAMSVSAIDRAKEQFHSALALLDRLPESAERYQRWRSVVRRLGFVSLFDPGPDEPALFELAARRAQERDDASGAAYAGYWAAYVNYARGNIAPSMAASRRALQLAEEQGDLGLAHQTWLTLGQSLAAAGRYDAALPMLQKVRPLRRPAAEETDAQIRQRAPAVAYALACQAAALGDLGRFDAAQQCFEQAMEAVPWPGHEVEGSVHNWRSAVALWQGDAELALQYAQIGLRVGERVRSLYLYGMGHCLQAVARWTLAPRSEYAADLLQSAGWLQREGKLLVASLNHGWLAEMAWTLGRHAEVREHAAHALRRHRAGDVFGAPRALRALAGLAWQSGDLPRAHRLLQHADRLSGRRQSGHEQVQNLRAWAACLRHSGQLSEANARRDEAQALAQAIGLRGELPMPPA